MNSALAKVDSKSYLGRTLRENRKYVWLDEGTKTSLSVWGEENIQHQLDGAVRNKTIYKRIAKEMREHGYKREWLQCRNKITLLVWDTF